MPVEDGANLLLMADGDVGLAIAEWLIDEYPKDISLLAVVRENEILEMAHGKGVEVHVCESDDSLNERASGLDIDLGILAWWPYIVAESTLNLAKNGFVNTHPSLLPYNRGKNYNFWALVEQAPFGVTLHVADPRIDAGDIVAQREILYGWEDTGETLYHKAKREMIQLVKSVYPSLRAGTFTRTPQDDGIGSFHCSSELDVASTLDLDKHYTARELLNLLRARTFSGFPGCRFVDGDAEYEVRVAIERKS